MKKLEDIIKENQHKLDVDEVPSDAWSGILKEWKGRNASRDYSNWWKIAAVLFFLSTAALIVYNIGSGNQATNQLASLGDISKEYKKMEKAYVSEINAIQTTINFDETTGYEDLEWLFQELEELDKINEIYRKDIGEVVNQERLVNALIDYYEKKLRLLRKIQLEINRLENEKDSFNYGV